MTTQLLTRLTRAKRLNFVTEARKFLPGSSGQMMRGFCTSQVFAQQSAEPEHVSFKTLKVNQQRLMDSIHYTSSFGTGKPWGNDPTETGMSRLSLSDSDKQARDWFVETTESLGCSVTVDTVGNIFAVRPGRSDGPPTCAGSHLDTQPTGGRYDGVLGVTAGVEMLQVLNEHDIGTAFPVGVVNWTNEEGARFPFSMMGSAVWAGGISLEHAYGLQAVSGAKESVESALNRIGYRGKVPASSQNMPLGAHFELHIEQGPILEAEQQTIGVVQGVQAYKWFTVGVRGRDAHTGTTPFSNRSDALLLASKLIIHSHRLATKHSALASTGILKLSPGSTNTIPGTVEFSLDIRSPRDEIVATLESELRQDFTAIASGKDVGGLHAAGTQGRNDFEITWREDFNTPATHFHKDCIQCVKEAAAETLANGDRPAERLFRNMSSGAGHDSVYTSHRCPTSMVFVPCRDGVSHNPAEYTSPGDCASGAQVLMQSVLKYDQLRSRGLTS